ncbi:tRNA lysidine(34) synthetase [Desulfovibrio ferrophilus]|uniref:PP-loop domain-containing protein n=1 Tax=Desulfovibrio ferrophilus TaxID=241368 RepID=A0A2Z6AXN3_9BACT|nr:tRNA 2-thiocytidine biosynthesis TtcA family protein [Desulfovibrio ferrophilus]BBD07968.1 PP-loop domain-containing protein [Desulfovibrio ferrophilus]
MARWGKLTYAQKQCLGATGKLMQQTEMVYPGARIGIAASGGVDSWLMLKILTMRQRIVPFPFELMVLHVNPGFDPHNHAPLAAWLKENGVAGHIELTDHGLRAHSDENQKKSACFYCAHQRRKRLFELCDQYKLTHLAMAHTADDLMATFFMNIFETGKVHGMSIKEDFFGGVLQMIRPLMYLEKKTVIKAAKDFDLPVWQNPCPSAGKTRRTETEDWLAERFTRDKRIKSNVLKALQRWQLDITLNTK